MDPGSRRATPWLLALGLSQLCAGVVQSAELRAGPDALRAGLAKLRAGDRLRLEAGRYVDGLRLRGLHGRKGAPIVVEGAGSATLFVARDGANTCELRDCSWLVLRSLRFEGGGRSVDAVKLMGVDREPVWEVRLEGLDIEGYDGSQQSCGISTKVPCWGVSIVGNRLRGVGTGLYLGNSDGSDPFVAGLIAENRIEQAIGYGMQIKHQQRWPPLPGAPGKASVTVIRDNVFAKGDRPSPDGDRPSVLLGGPPLEGEGASQRVVVCRNVFYGNPRESLLQATGRVSVHDNVFALTQGPAVRIQSHHGRAPLSLAVYHNSFVATMTPLSVSRAVSGIPMIIAHNLWLDERRAGPWRWPQNIALAGRDALRAVRGPLLGLGRMDLQPRRLLKLRSVAPGLAQAVGSERHGQLDLFGRSKPSLRHVGALAKKARGAKPLGKARRAGR